VTTYGLPTALCRGVPRIVFPWGGDVFTYAESSPFHFALTRFCLRAVDLVVPSSTTAARHICRRFKVAPEKVQAISWGVDRNKFKRAEGEDRRALCAKWGIGTEKTIIVNPRRFRPDWGGFVALEAFMQIAADNPNTHFILFAGRGTEKFTLTARSNISTRHLESQFTVLEGEASLDVCAELMSISDVFVSLLGRGDMRSATVLQAAASGAAPVVSDNAEYREMERMGFRASFVAPDNVADVIDALRTYINDPAKTRAVVDRNDEYLAAHENYSSQMDKMLGLIEQLCARYSERQ
jgi:glycosyltransferase involved in cell wall biosynthesis